MKDQFAHLERPRYIHIQEQMPYGIQRHGVLRAREGRPGQRKRDQPGNHHEYGEGREIHHGIRRKQSDRPDLISGFQCEEEPFLQRKCPRVLI